jgi:hypothetical protein
MMPHPKRDHFDPPYWSHMFMHVIPRTSWASIITNAHNHSYIPNSKAMQISCWYTNHSATFVYLTTNAFTIITTWTVTFLSTTRYSWLIMNRTAQTLAIISARAALRIATTTIRRKWIIDEEEIRGRQALFFASSGRRARRSMCCR